MSEKTNDNALENITRKAKATSEDLFTRTTKTFKRMDKPAKILVLVLFIAVAAEIPLFLGIGGAFNQSPVLSGATPAAFITVNEGEETVFGVSTSDPEGGVLLYQWTLNGVSVGDNRPSFTFTPDYMMGGLVYALDLAVFDGKNRVDQVWTINITNAPIRLCDTNLVEIEHLFVVGDKIFFFDEYDDPDNLVQLWCSDGSPEGTRVVKNLYDNGPISRSDIATTEDALYFVYSNGKTDEEIWKTDGTSIGMIQYSNFSMINPNIANLYAWRDWIFFAANNDSINYGTELWKTDGTTTVLVKDIFTGSGESWPSDFIAAGDRLFFIADNGTERTLWCTDSTPGGTLPVKNLTIDNGVEGMCILGNSLLAFASDGNTGEELWKIDSSGSNTVLVKDICPGAPGCDPNYPRVNGNVLYFSADNGTTGNELWKSDGTTAGTVLVKDLYAGSDDSDIESISPFGSIILFEGSDADHGSELWRSDGTTAGTYFVKDIYPGSGSNSSYPYVDSTYSYGIAAGRAIFPAEDGICGRELWSTDGTEIGTRLVMDFFEGDSGDSSDPEYFRTIGNAAFFIANDGTGEGLYVF